MTIAKHSIVAFKGIRKIFGPVAIILFALCTVGCATSPSGGIHDSLSFSEKAALKKAVANDSFPTASQAGITSNVSSGTK